MYCSDSFDKHKPVYAVDENNGYNLSQSNGQQWNRSSKAVKKSYPIHPRVLRKQEGDDERNKTCYSWNTHAQKQGSVCKSRPETNKNDVSFRVEKAELNFKNQVTSHGLIRPIFRKYIQVFKWDYHALNGAKLTWESQAEKHDEEEDSPDRRTRHLADGFSKHNERQTCSLHSLHKHTNINRNEEETSEKQSKFRISYLDGIRQYCHLAEKCVHVTGS